MSRVRSSPGPPIPNAFRKEQHEKLDHPRAGDLHEERQAVLRDNGWALPDGIVWLRWRMAAGTKLFVAAPVLGIGLWVFGTVKWWSVRDHRQHVSAIEDLALIALFLLVGVGIIVLIDRRYRIGYDDDALYMRPHGLSFRAEGRKIVRLPFDEVAAVAAERSARSGAYGNRFTPFEYAHVYRRHPALEEDKFALVGGELHDSDFRALLRLIDEKAPGTLDETVTTWLGSSRRF